MKRYEKYSIAANLLTNEIPSHWTMMRNRVFLRPKLVPVGQDANKYPLLSLTTKGIVFRDIESGKGKFPKDFDTYQAVEPNDIVFCLFDVDETPRTVGLSSLNGMLTGAYDTFSMSNVVSPQFINYYYTAVDDVKALRPYYSGLRKVVKKDKFMAISIPLPPIPEQNKIVAYLDKRITLIENCKCQRDRELQTLNELKQAEIASVVTRGLNPDVPMKDSGIPWIGQIPKHWELRRFKTVCSLIREPSKKGDKKIALENIESNTGRLIATDSVFDGEGVHFEPGDILFGKLRPYLAKVYLAKESAQAVGDFYVFRSNGSIIPAYLHKLIISAPFIGVVNAGTYGTKMPRASWQDISQLNIPLPPIEEQNFIVEYIESKTNKIDTMIEALKAEIDRLTEYKQRLISDVVTGQIDVRGEQI